MQLSVVPVAAITVCTLLFACSPGQQLRIVETEEDQRFRIEPRPVGMTAIEADDIPGIASLADRIVTGPATVPSAQPVAARFLPLIYASAQGQLFSTLGPSRALTSGDPAASCPALTSGSGDTPRAAAQSALTACLAQLRENRADDGCGCRLMALDDVALAPRDAFAYAPGLATRVLRDGALDPLTYIAEEVVVGERREAIIFAGDRPVWSVRPVDPTRAEITRLGRDGAADGPVETASRQILGLDRGRFIERIDAAGLTLLIGF